MNNLTAYKLTEIIQLQDIIKSNELDYKLKHRKTYNFNKYPSSIFFLRYIYDIELILEEADNEQSKLINELMGIDRLVEKKWLKTKTFLINGRLLFNTKKKFLMNLKATYFH